MARIVLGLAATLSLAIAPCRFSFADEADMARGISDEELALLGERWADALNAGDAAELSGMIDLRALGLRGADSFSDNAEEQADFAAGFARGASRMAQTWIADVRAADGHVKFLRVRDIDEMRGPLIRYDLGDGGYNYSLLIAESSTDSGLLVVDMYVATSGERLSDSVGAISRLLLAPDDSLLGKLFGLTDVDPGLLTTFQEFSRLRTAGDNAGAFAKLNELPEAMRNHRVIVNFSLGLASVLDPDLYHKELERLALHHRNDPTAGFALVDYYFYEGEFATAVSIVEGMELTFGADAALAGLKSNLAMAGGDLSLAEQYARQSIKLEPDLEDGYWSLLTSLVQAAKHADAVLVLGDLERQFGYRFEQSTFAGDEMFKALVRSSEFSAWLRDGASK